MRERCDCDEFEDWAAFVAEPQQQPRGGRRRSPASPPRRSRGAARLYATGGNGAIYYGLGVTEHSQGSTTVMAIANLAMATGNIGRPGVGVNPLRGQNNVQGSCDMGSFPHELSGYRHISDDATRAHVRGAVGRHARRRAGPAHSQHVRRRRSTARFKGLYIQGEDILQSDPNTKHVAAGAGGDGMRRRAGPVPERDRELRPRLPARLDLPGEGRHLHQRRAPHPARAQGDDAAATAMADWEVTHRARQGDGLSRCTTTIRPRSWTRSRALTPTFAGVSFDKLDELGSVQWPCNEKAPEGTPVMHIGGFVRGKGKFMITEYVADRRADRPALPAAAHHRPHPQPVQCRRADAAHRRTSSGTSEDVLEIHPHDAEQRGIRDGDWVKLDSRAGETTLARADHRSRRAGRGLHHLPPSRTRRPTSSPPTISDWATNCPEYKVTAVQVSPSNGPTDWQEDYDEQARQSRRIAPCGGRGVSRCAIRSAPSIAQVWRDGASRRGRRARFRRRPRSP